MWQNNNMYGGFYDRMYGYKPPSNGNSMVMQQANPGYNQPYGQGFIGNNYNPRRLQPIQPGPPAPTPQQQQYVSQGKESQMRRLSRPSVQSAAYATQQFDDAGSSCESSFADSTLPAVAVPSVAMPQTYAPPGPRRFSSGQLHPLQRNMSMRNANGLSTYSLPASNSQSTLVLQQSQPQANPAGSQLGMQSRGSFRRSNSGYGASGFDTVSLQRIDSGFDSRPTNSFRGAGGLERQFSNLVGDADFYKYEAPTDAGNGGGSNNYPNNNNTNNNGKSAGLQRGNGGGNSLYRLYSFSNPNNADSLNRGISTYGSLYGGQNLYGDAGGNNRGGTSLYGTMSTNNLQPSYSFVGSTIASYGSEFALLDGATEENEFGGGSTTTASDTWNASTATDYYVPKSASVSPLPTIASSNGLTGPALGPRPRSHSAPASRPASQQSSASPPNERPGSGQRRRRQRPQKRAKNEEDLPQISTFAANAPAVPPPQPAAPPPPQHEQREEEILVPIKRRSSAPVNASRSPVTPFEQMRALRRVQTSAYQSPAPQPSLNSSMIGRRRGTSGGLMFSGAAVV